MHSPGDDVGWRLAVHSDMVRELPPATGLRLASDHGYAGAFWATRSEGELAAVRAAVVESNVTITCLGFDLEASETVDPTRAVELADSVGAAAISVCATPMQASSFIQDALDRTLRRCAAYVDAGAPRGVKVLVHQHWGTLAASASQLRRIVQEFDPARLGCVYDAGSMTIEGYEDYRIGLEILGSYVADVHIANTRHFPSAERTVWEWEWSPLSDGLLDMQKLARALRRAGYDGWLTIADRTTGGSVERVLDSDRRIVQQATTDVEGIGSHNPCRPLDDHVAVADRARRGSYAQPLLAETRG
jgi:sugar phosphate isomerase/epimerase